MCAFGQQTQPATSSAATGSGTASSTSSTDTTASAVTYEVGPPPQLRANANQINAITITAKAGDKPKAGIKIRGTSDSDVVLLYIDKPIPGSDKNGPSQTVEATTDDSGVAKFSILTKSDHPPKTQIRLIPLTGAGNSDDGGNVQVLTLTTLSTHEQSLGSKLSYLQLFTGTTFTNNYDTAGNNTGFGNGGPIIRLTFDTMWKHQRAFSPRSAQPICACRLCSEPQKKEAQCFSSEKVPNVHAFADGAWHTDLNVEFTKFPFALTPQDTQQLSRSAGRPALTPRKLDNGEQQTTNGPLENAFSGTVGATWQPNRWSHYDEREGVAEDEPHYDAYRWEAFSKAGVTTRAQQSTASHNQSIDRIQIGFRFTHRRSYKPDAASENRNLEPIRFIEISLAGFSNWQGQEHARRVVIDGGLRLGALSNDVFPVYLGAHLNTGPGPDDLRVFIGVLMKLDKLANLVKNAGISTGD